MGQCGNGAMRQWAGIILISPHCPIGLFPIAPLPHCRIAPLPHYRILTLTVGGSMAVTTNVLRESTWTCRVYWPGPRRARSTYG